MRRLAFVAVWTCAAALVQPTLKLKEFKPSTGFGVRLNAEPETAEALMEKAAELRAEVAAEEVKVAVPSAEDARAKITAALKRATQLRDKDQLQIALGAAEEAGFSGNDEDVRNAVVAYNQLAALTDTMRSRLVAEARSQGGDPSVDWNPGVAYAGIFGVMSVLVLLGGKGIFF
mmetsp:Transcript_9112/g.23169  ORF Transcript_9112/g.23169 Transcript_9112/m.23169 type:complete len:174 (-) Transcript_9112:141-662(-)